MNKTNWLIVQCADRWKLLSDGKQLATASVQVDTPAGIQPSAAIGAALYEAGYRGQPVGLALRTESCLAARFEVEDSSVLRSATAMMYEFEHWMPLSAEEMVADFSILGRSVFGVGVSTERCLPLLEQLAENDVVVASISSFTMLALEKIVKESPFGTALHWIMIENEGKVEAVRVEQNLPANWLQLSSDGHIASQLLRAGARPGGNEGAIWAIGDSRSIAQEVASRLNWKLQQSDSVNLDEAAMDSNVRVIGGQQPWIELRRGEFFSGDPFSSIRKSLNFAMFATVLGLLLAIGGLFWRTQQLWQLQLGHRRAQEKVYAQLHPGAAIPKGIKMRLSSEAKKSDDQNQLSQIANLSKSPLVLAQSFLSALPQDFKFRVSKISFLTDGKIKFDAELNVRADGEKLRNSLVENGFEVTAFPTRFQNDRVTIQQGELTLIAGETSSPSPSGQH